MKAPSLQSLLALLALCSTGLFVARAPAADRAPVYLPHAARVVTSYLAAAERDDEAAWARYAEARALGPGEFAATCGSVLATARALVRGGVPATSEHFAPLLLDSLGIAGGGAAPADAVPGPREGPPRRPADPASPEEFPEVKLRHDAAELTTKIKAQEKEVEGEGADQAKKAAAQVKLAELKGALTANLAQQEFLRLRKEAAAPGLSEAARAERSARRDLAEAGYLALEKALKKPEADDFKGAGAPSFFHTGIRQLSPYKLTIDNSSGVPVGTLDKADGGSSGYFEYVYSNRWAWNQARLRVADGLAAGPVDGRFGYGAMLRDWLSDDPLDFEAKLSFGFAKEAKVDASAIAGSGDVGVEFNLARHLYRVKLDGDDGFFSVNAEAGYGLTTDKSAFDAHQRVFAGISYTGSFSGWGAETGSVLLNFRGGYTKIDALQFKSRSSREIELQYGDLPRYRLEDAWTLEADFIYPLRADAHLTLGARVIGGLDPNPWTVYVGYTKSLGEIARALLPGGDGEKEKPAAKPDDEAKKTQLSPPRM